MWRPGTCHPEQLVPLLLLGVLLSAQMSAGGAGDLKRPRVLLYPFAHCPNSHLLNMEKLMAVLLNAGYDVTMLVPDTYVLPTNDARFTQVHLKKFRAPDGVRSICGFDSMEDFLRTPLIDILKTFYRGTYAYCTTLLSQRAVLDDIKRGHYDLAIYDAVDQCSKILADYIDVPFIVFHTSGMESILPRNPAFLPSMMTTNTDDMTLWQRTKNTLGYVVQLLIVRYTYNYYQQLRIEQNMNTSLSVYDSFDRAALRFILGEWGLDYVGPTQPSHIMLGGAIRPQPEPLSQQLSAFLDSAGEEGVVVLSFGSIAREFGPTWRELFADALARLPHRVVWRYDETPPVRLGNNTLLLPWIPQAELLGHPNVRAFITHCGMNAAYEAAFSGVPVIAIPLFADQFFQASKLVNHIKMGEQLDIRALTSDKLYDAIMRVASSAIYRHNAREISTVMQDRPFSQSEQISTWVGYVTRHGGAKHLHCKGFDLEWYQLYLVDVGCVLLCILLVTLTILYIILRRLFCIMKNTYTQVITVQSTSLKDTNTKARPVINEELQMKAQSNFHSDKKSPSKEAT